jgi:nitroreductase
MDRSRLTEVVNLIKERRTNLRIDPDRPVEVALIAELCEAAVWAPNHRLTEPWRFATLTGAARNALGEVAAAGLLATGRTDEARLARARSKFVRAPVVLAVGCRPEPESVRYAEDRDAVAAGIQNLLLAATAAGLASYWATGIAARQPATAELCGFEAGTEIVALIYLGWPIGETASPGRATPIINWVSGGE